MIEFKAERSVFQEWWFIIFTNIHKTLKGLWLGLNYYYHIQTKKAYIRRFYSSHNCSNSNPILYEEKQCSFLYKVYPSKVNTKLYLNYHSKSIRYICCKYSHQSLLPIPYVYLSSIFYSYRKYCKNLHIFNVWGGFLAFKYIFIVLFETNLMVNYICT